MTDTLTADDFWKRLDDVRAGMLSLGHGRPVPMSHYADRDAHALWFISAAGTDIVQAAENGPAPARYIVASGDGHLYARIDGRAHLSQDTRKLDELWSAVAAAWFEDGRRDDDVRLVCVELAEAEVWTTPGRLGFLYDIARAQVTDETPDGGAHGQLSFAA